MFKLFRKIDPAECRVDDDPVVSSTGTSNVSSGGELGKEDIIEFLAGDDEDKEILDIKPKKEVKEDKGKEKDKEDKEDKEVEVEVDELAEIEDELEPPTDEQLELVTPVRRKEILAKYPTLFKDFPYLEKAYYREQQFTELLPTIDDAKIAVKKAQVLDQFEHDVINEGNTEKILKAVHDENPQAFGKLVDNYLETLAKVDEKAHLHLLGNITKYTIMSMVKEARASKNDVLMSAAQVLNQFAFGSSEFAPPQNLSKNQPVEDGKTKEINEREQAFVRQQFETTTNELNTRVNNTLKNTIEANIDPRNSMTEFVKRHAINEALEGLSDLISRDTRFKALADKLWEKAAQDNFSKKSIDLIKSAYLSKSKTLLPSVIKKARDEALRGMGKRVDDNDDNKTQNKGPIATGQPRSQQPSGKIKNAKDIPKEMKTLDFLNSD